MELTFTSGIRIHHIRTEFTESCQFKRNYVHFPEQMVNQLHQLDLFVDEELAVMYQKLKGRRKTQILSNAAYSMRMRKVTKSVEKIK